MFEVILHRDEEHGGKVTKHGYIRYSEAADPHSKSIYLSPDEVKELGNPNAIKVTVEPSA